MLSVLSFVIFPLAVATAATSKINFLQDEYYRTIAGTKSYYPPEWFQYKQYDGVKMDLWSFAVQLYHAAELDIPFKPEPGVHDNRDLTFEGGASPALQSLLRKMLVTDEFQRLNIDEALADPWFY